jgi:hypothetical protein
VQVRKAKPLPPAEFAPWTTAHFQTQANRDRFILAAASFPEGDIEAESLLDEKRGAMVRWRPGQFLSLNDIAHAHGGRIIVTGGRGHFHYSGR